MTKYLNLRANIALGLTFAFLFNSLGPVPIAQADEFTLPAPSQMVALSPAYSPVVLKGIKLDPKNPFRFHFYVDTGNNSSIPVIPAKAPPLDGTPPKAVAGIQNQEQLKTESTKLIKYFLASLTIPEKDLWVNLSPYEKDRIVPPSFGQTEMGRDLLAQDYLLKQITASLIYPESKLGKEFWAKVYAQAQAKYGTTNIPINTFNKVWIVPDKAVVYENKGTAFVLENHLKVMLEQDYLSMSKHQPHGQPGDMTSVVSPSTLPNEVALNAKAPQVNPPSTNELGSQIVREIVIPALTREVNEGKNFSQLRQVFYSLILATWYKKKIKDSILNKVYSNQNKIKGLIILDSNTVIPAKAPPLDGTPPKAVAGIHNKNDVDYIYQQYLKAFKKGVYNYIKEEPDPITNQNLPRKYFSGGVNAQLIGVNLAMIGPKEISHTQILALDSAQLVDVKGNFAMIGFLKKGLSAIKASIQRSPSNKKVLLELVNNLPMSTNPYFLIRSIFVDISSSDLSKRDFIDVVVRLNQIWCQYNLESKYGDLNYLLSYFSRDTEFTQKGGEDFVRNSDYLLALIRKYPTTFWTISLYNIDKLTAHLRYSALIHPLENIGHEKDRLIDSDVLIDHLGIVLDQMATMKKIPLLVLSVIASALNLYIYPSHSYDALASTLEGKEIWKLVGRNYFGAILSYFKGSPHQESLASILWEIRRLSVFSSDGTNGWFNNGYKEPWSGDFNESVLFKDDQPIDAYHFMLQSALKHGNFMEAALSDHRDLDDPLLRSMSQQLNISRREYYLHGLGLLQKVIENQAQISTFKNAAMNSENPGFKISRRTLIIGGAALLVMRGFYNKLKHFQSKNLPQNVYLFGLTHPSAVNSKHLLELLTSDHLPEILADPIRRQKNARMLKEYLDSRKTSFYKERQQREEVIDALRKNPNIQGIGYEIANPFGERGVGYRVTAQSHQKIVDLVEKVRVALTSLFADDQSIDINETFEELLMVILNEDTYLALKYGDIVLSKDQVPLEDKELKDQQDAIENLLYNNKMKFKSSEFRSLMTDEEFQFLSGLNPGDREVWGEIELKIKSMLEVLNKKNDINSLLFSEELTDFIKNVNEYQDVSRKRSIKKAENIAIYGKNILAIGGEHHLLLTEATLNEIAHRKNKKISVKTHSAQKDIDELKKIKKTTNNAQLTKSANTAMTANDYLKGLFKVNSNKKALLIAEMLYFGQHSLRVAMPGIFADLKGLMSGGGFNLYLGSLPVVFVDSPESGAYFYPKDSLFYINRKQFVLQTNQEYFLLTLVGNFDEHHPYDTKILPQKIKDLTDLKFPVEDLKKKLMPSDKIGKRIVEIASEAGKAGIILENSNIDGELVIRASPLNRYFSYVTGFCIYRGELYVGSLDPNKNFNIYFEKVTRERKVISITLQDVLKLSKSIQDKLRGNSAMTTRKTLLWLAIAGITVVTMWNVPRWSRNAGYQLSGVSLVPLAEQSTNINQLYDLYYLTSNAETRQAVLGNHHLDPDFLSKIGEADMKQLSILWRQFMWSFEGGERKSILAKGLDHIEPNVSTNNVMGQKVIGKLRSWTNRPSVEERVREIEEELVAIALNPKTSSKTVRQIYAFRFMSYERFSENPLYFKIDLQTYKKVEGFLTSDQEGIIFVYWPVSSYDPVYPDHELLKYYYSKHPIPLEGIRKRLEEKPSSPTGVNSILVNPKIGNNAQLSKDGAMIHQGVFRLVPDEFQGGSLVIWENDKNGYVLKIPKGSGYGNLTAERIFSKIGIYQSHLIGLAPETFEVHDVMVNLNGEIKLVVGAIVQKRVKTLRNKLHELFILGDNQKIRSIIKEWWGLQVMLWKRGVHDEDIKILDNYGYDEAADKVLILDFTHIFTDMKDLPERAIEAHRISNRSKLRIEAGNGAEEAYKDFENEILLSLRNANGGIDLNPAQMSMQVKTGPQDFKFDFNGEEIDAAQVTGATFTIDTMTPVTNLPEILGFNSESADKSNQISAKV